MGTAVSGFDKVVGSSPVQGTLKTLAYAALPLLAAFKVIPTLVNALGLRQLATSGPVRGALAGLAQSGAVGGGLAARLGGQRYLDVLARGEQPGSARMAPINERARGRARVWAASCRRAPRAPGRAPSAS